MKQSFLKISILFFSLVLLFVACKDDELESSAEIVISFKVKGTSGTLFNSVISGDSIKIKVSPYLDAEVELESVTPIFYLSKGATVSPDPKTTQNFAQKDGVRYTVTSENGQNRHEYIVSYGVSDQLPYGSGFSYAEIGLKKNFVELGYPGELNNWSQPDSKLFGDLIMYPAYCGNHLVLLSRAYANTIPTSKYCVRVVDKENLNDVGSLNLGSISIEDLKLITSDYKGRCVGAVVKNGETEIFYWTKFNDIPKSIGKVSINIASFNDGASNFQVAGDITSNAWITAFAPRSSKGEHYRIKVTGGQLSQEYSTIETGFSSADCSGFQMISPLDDSDKPSFVVGDTEGKAGAANSIHCYINSYTGLTTHTMPGLWQNTLQSWWVGTGFATLRYGGRSPAVSALVINGKSYVAVTSGTGWWHAAAVLTPDLQTLTHENLNIAASVNRGWSYGSMLDWYWNEEAKEAYLAVWFGRLGLFTYKLTCFE